MTTAIHRTVHRTVAAAVATAALVIGAAGVASAASVTVADKPTDAPGSVSDITSVTVKHTKKNVVMITSFADLQPTYDGSSSLAMFLDSSDAVGPELRLATGLQDGTDYQLVAMWEGRPHGEPLTCAHSVKLDFDANTVKAKVSRACLGKPATVRVGVKMTDHVDADHVVTDWLKGKRAYTTWLAVG